MAGFTIKGVSLGEGRPKTIVSLMEKTEEALVARGQAAVAAGAECVEWRVDFARDVYDHAAMAQTARALAKALPHTPLLVTLRSAAEGGAKEFKEGEQAALVRALLASGAADMVDVEARLGDAAVRELVHDAHAKGVRVVVSRHDFAGTTSVEQMLRDLTHMAELGCDLPKLAVMAHSTRDCLHLMEACALARERLGGPVVTMAMGSHGTLSRVAGQACGSALTFCALGTPSAPGQVELGRALRVLDDLSDIV